MCDKKRIMLATDLHYLSKKINDYGKAFTETIEKGDGKLMLYIEEIVDEFFSDVKKVNPDVLLISGDLTFNGERKSHEDLADKLRTVSESGIPIYIIPGNHDINCNKSMGFLEEDTYDVDSVSAEEFREIYSFCGYENYEAFDEFSGSYTVRIGSNLYLLMLDTNSYEMNRVGEKSIIWLGNVLDEIYKNGGKVLAVSHQNILEHNHMFTKGFMIENADRIRKIYGRYHIHLNLSGHMHIQHIENMGIAEVVTSSLVVYPNHFANIIYDGESFDYFTQVLKVDTIENFSDISRREFCHVGERQMSKLFNSTEFEGLNPKKIKRLSDTFIKMNELYFSGEVFKSDGLEDVIRFWESRNDSYTSEYIKSMLQSVFKEHNMCKVLLGNED